MFIFCDVLTCSSDPDEVIYDDVPRENSDSNTGLCFIFLKFSMKHSIFNMAGGSTISFVSSTDFIYRRFSLFFLLKHLIKIKINFYEIQFDQIQICT